MIGKVDDVNPSTPRPDHSTAPRTRGLGLLSTRHFDESFDRLKALSSIESVRPKVRRRIGQ